jgi:ribosomal protein L29
MLSQRKKILLSRKKYYDLDEKHKELELQYNILWDCNSHPSKAKDTSTPSTSQGYGKCYNINLNTYSTNLANMEAMRKEIARLNEIIGKGCLSGKAQVYGKCYNIDLNTYSTNLANMETMRKEIARLNEIIGKGYMSGKAQVSVKMVNEPKGPHFKQGRHPSIKHGLSHMKGAKTNGRKIVNGYECVKAQVWFW